MSSTNFLLIIVGLISSVIVVNHLQKTKENFAGLNYPMTWKVNREVKVSPNDMYSVSGNFQSSLSPRFSNVNYGANIRYNLPSHDNMGVPKNPISYDYDDFKETVVENFQTEGSDDPNWNMVPRSESDLPNFNDKAWKRIKNKNNRSSKPSCGNKNGLRSDGANEYTQVSDMLPVNDMETVASTMNRQDPSIQSKAGKQSRSGTQPIVYDRFVYANAKSRLRNSSDPFRGDLPIVPVLPESNRNSLVMFRPSVAPHIDLNKGYLAAAGGYDNTTNNQLRSLMNASIDGTLQTFGGNNIPVNRSTLRGSNGDIVVSNFS